MGMRWIPLFVVETEGKHDANYFKDAFVEEDSEARDYISCWDVSIYDKPVVIIYSSSTYGSLIVKRKLTELGLKYHALERVNYLKRGGIDKHDR